MLDVAALRALLTPDTVIVHLAAKAGVRPSLADPVGYARANVTGTAAVLEAARSAGVSRIVFGSSSSVYGDSTPVPFREDAVAIEPVSPYAATKRAGELLLELGGADLRLSGRRRSASSPSMARGSVPTWRSTPSRGRWSRARPSRCSATAPRRATTPTATTSSPASSRRSRWTDDRAGRRRAVQSRRQPLGPHRRDGRRDRRGRSASSRRSSGRRCSRATCSGPPPISPSRARCSAMRPRRRFRRGSGASSPGSGRPMAGQTERPLARARERFAVQDYYGAVHLLEEIVAAGRAFADVHHLLGVSLSLLGQRERALARVRPRAGAQSALSRGADPPGPGAHRAGPRRRGRGVVPPRGGQRRRRRPRGFRRRSRPSSPTSTPSWRMPTPRPARSTGRSNSTSARSSWARASWTCATAWRG